MRDCLRSGGNSVPDNCDGLDAMTHSQSARAFEIRIARTVMLFNGMEYRKALPEINAYTSPLCKSVAWSIYNRARDRYLKSMAQLRSALKTPKGE